MNLNITLRQLRAFLAVADQGSFTNAATHLNITQSALTTAVKNLETELGLKLFDRTTRQVEPTLHGRQFAAVAHRFTEDFERAVEDMRAHAERQQGQVVVGATATLITSVLVPALNELAARYPGIRVRLVEVLTGEAIERVLAGDMDLAFTTISPSDRELTTIPVMRDQFAIVCDASHPLANKSSAQSWEVFRRYPTISLLGESGIRNILSGHESGQEAIRQLTYEVSSIAGLTRMIRDGLGISAVPGFIARTMAADGVHQVPLRPAVYRTVSLISRPGRSPTPAASALVSVALTQLRKLSGHGVDIPVTEEQLTEAGFDLG